MKQCFKSIPALRHVLRKKRLEWQIATVIPGLIHQGTIMHASHLWLTSGHLPGTGGPAPTRRGH